MVQTEDRQGAHRWSHLPSARGDGEGDARVEQDETSGGARGVGARQACGDVGGAGGGSAQAMEGQAGGIYLKAEMKRNSRSFAALRTSSRSFAARRLTSK